ncbi:hypothetical protein B0H12DRAFT_1327076 [Mycena haematopus]|nr:hypothetical protein B0H12DRAFT_1327076 [Mycena haematopus]
MSTTPLSMRVVVLEQKERTRKSSKADVERFIEELDLKITSLESQISALVELCNRERACVAALRHLNSPIHTLPVELLAEIFELTIRDSLHVKEVFRISQLRNLSIHFASNALSILVPWAQLTDLTLGAGFPNIALDVLGQCANLIKATVSTAGWDVLPEARQDIVVLSHLHFLALDFFGVAGHVLPFLDHLSAPVLKQLSLDFGDIDVNPYWTEARFTAFQLRAPNITQLDLRDSSLTSDDLRTAIRHAPSLICLQITLALLALTMPSSTPYATRPV